MSWLGENVERNTSLWTEAAHTQIENNNIWQVILVSSRKQKYGVAKSTCRLKIFASVPSSCTYYIFLVSFSEWFSYITHTHRHIYIYIYIYIYMKRFANEFELSILSFLFHTSLLHTCFGLRSPLQETNNEVRNAFGADFYQIKT